MCVCVCVCVCIILAHEQASVLRVVVHAHISPSLPHSSTPSLYPSLSPPLPRPLSECTYPRWTGYILLNTENFSTKKFAAHVRARTHASPGWITDLAY